MDEATIGPPTEKYHDAAISALHFTLIIFSVALFWFGADWLASETDRRPLGVATFACLLLLFAGTIICGQRPNPHDSGLGEIKNG